MGAKRVRFGSPNPNYTPLWGAQARFFVIFWGSEKTRDFKDPKGSPRANESRRKQWDGPVPALKEDPDPPSRIPAWDLNPKMGDMGSKR